ncbi:hypothetical protein D3C75_661430 [compost metagenome]
MNAALLQHFEHQLQTCLFTGCNTSVEVVRTDQLAQRKVAFYAGTWGSDTDHFLRLAQNICRALHRLFSVQGDQIVATTLDRLTWTILQVDVAITEAATVTQEVVVHGTVIAVFDTTQFTIALTRACVTADAALLANARCELHIPLTVIALGVSFVREHAGRADFYQVTGEFALKRAVFRATEVDVIVRAINTQVGAVSVIFVITYAAVTGDTAVHFVRDERAETLITVSTFGEAIAAEAMTGHDRHILQVAVAAFFTNRAVVWVVGHQPFHNAFTEFFCFTVINRDERAVRGRCHTRHHQAATKIFCVLILLHRALAASTDAA